LILDSAYVPDSSIHDAFMLSMIGLTLANPVLAMAW